MVFLLVFKLPGGELGERDFPVNRASLHKLLMAAYASIHTLTYLRMKHIHQGRELNQILGATARNILIYGLACTAAILIP